MSPTGFLKSFEAQLSCWFCHTALNNSSGHKGVEELRPEKQTLGLVIGSVMKVWMNVSHCGLSSQVAT